LLYGRHSGEAVVNEIEDIIEAGYRKNVFGHNGNIAENKLTPTLLQQIAQYHQIADTRRSYYLDSEKINHHVTGTSGTDDFVKIFELIPYSRFFRRQINEKNIF
jgi:hypothetical protein